MRLIPLLLIGWTASAQVLITQHPTKISIAIDHQPEIAFLYGPDVTKPYLYPLRAPSGDMVTRQWPMDARTGERHDHIHHRGVWFAHSSVNGFDFWNSDPSYHDPHMGRIEVSKINRIASGPQNGVMDADLDWKTPSGEVLLREHRTMTFFSGDPRLIDFDITLTARQRAVFGDDKDGVFGMRLAPELEEPAKDAPREPVRTGVMTSSNGCHQEAECWGKRANWIDVSGKIGDRMLGISILDHPQNPRHPTYWHARGYGLLAANIFGVKAFSKDPGANGSLTLEAGGSLRFRYRVVIHSGDAQTAGIEHLYSVYTEGTPSASLR